MGEPGGLLHLPLALEPRGRSFWGQQVGSPARAGGQQSAECDPAHSLPTKIRWGGDCHLGTSYTNEVLYVHVLISHSSPCELGFILLQFCRQGHCASPSV